MPTFRQPLTILGAALALAACADLLFYGRSPGISLPLFSGGLLLALEALARAEDRPASPANRWLGPAALLFAAMVAWRDSPVLVALNSVAALGLLALALCLYRAESLWRLGPWRLLVGGLGAGLAAAFLPVSLAGQALGRLPAMAGPSRGLLVLGRGLALAAPVLFVFAGLLALADGIFASYLGELLSLRLPLDPAEALSHTVVIGGLTWALAGGLIVALRDGRPGGALWPGPGLPAEGETQPLRLERPGALGLIGWGEAMVVLALTNGLFAAFMAIQGAYLFGGLDTLQRTGMSFAEYARRGFFELVTVAVLALGLLVGLALLGRRRPGGQRAAFNLACLAMVALLLGMLGSAAYRMWLYEQAYGFTELRLYTHSFMAWLAVALLLFIGALLAGRPALFSHGAPAAAAAALLALNLINPDAQIVRWNVARYQATGDLDAAYIGQLSADALPAARAALPSLAEPARAELAAELDRLGEWVAWASERDGWPGWRLSRALALWPGNGR